MNMKKINYMKNKMKKKYTYILYVTENIIKK